MIGRELSVTEKRLHEVEKTLTVVHWGIRKAARYTSHNTQLTVVLRSPELKVLASDQLIHARLRAKFLDLAAYNVKYEVDAAHWNFDG